MKFIIWSYEYLMCSHQCLYNILNPIHFLGANLSSFLAFSLLTIIRYIKLIMWHHSSRITRQRKSLYEQSNLSKTIKTLKGFPVSQIKKLFSNHLGILSCLISTSVAFEISHIHVRLWLELSNI